MEKEESNKKKATSDLNKKVENERMKIEEPEKYHVTIENNDWKVIDLKKFLTPLMPNMSLSGNPKATLQNFLIECE